jgi:hypothetical protein
MTTEEKIEVLVELPGTFQAEILHSLLETEGIESFLSQEGIGHTYGLTFGVAGRVQVLVRASQLEKARQILDDFETSLHHESTPDEAGSGDEEIEE